VSPTHTCARSVQAAAQCVARSCRSCKGATEDEIEQCSTAARNKTSGACKTYVTAADTCLSAMSASDPADRCFSGDGFTDYTTIATLFCGP
jgi:hypothetical protein